jgi:hypothetical protein
MAGGFWLGLLTPFKVAGPIVGVFLGFIIQVLVFYTVLGYGFRL